MPPPLVWETQVELRAAGCILAQLLAIATIGGVSPEFGRFHSLTLPFQ